MKHTECIICYMTVPTQKVARRIGKALVEARLAACVNIGASVQSFYWWKGRVDEAKEVGILAKTRRSRVSDLVQFVKKIHPYDCPCVVTWSIEDGNTMFLQWVKDETAVQSFRRPKRPARIR